MSDRIPFIALHSRTRGVGHTVLVIGRRGEVISKIGHYPWFVSSIPFKNNNVVRVVELPGRMLVLDESANVYLPTEKAYKIEVTHKKLVPQVAREVLGKHGRAGLFNIIYEVRVAFDIQGNPQNGKVYGILGYPTPLAFLPNDEMISHMEKVIDDVGDIKVLAVDIEVYSTRGGFPAKGDPILSITYSTFKLKDNIFTRDWAEKNVKYILNESADRKGTREVVKKFEEVISREKPDIIVGFNTGGFDFPYMQPFTSRFEFHPETVIDMKEDRYYPHVDLMIVRDRLGSSLGLRSQSVFALDDVTIEALKGNKVNKFYDIDWLFNSKYLEAERKLDHAKLKEYFDRKDELFFDYIVADVYLTSLLARIWLYPMFLLSVLTGIPITVLQRLNVGQMSEYVFTELLFRLGFYPELRYRSKNFSRVVWGKEKRELRTELEKRVKDWWVFEKGKVYVTKPGVYGGGDHYIVELDFAQLYPTDMVFNTSDPTSIYITKGWEYVGDRLSYIRPTVIFNGKDIKITELRTWSLLKDKGKNGKEHLELYETIPGYGPISWFIYKMYTARWETKKMKKLAKKEKRVELLAPDQAVKIYNNSSYGAFSKQRGNLVHELLSASVFWRTQRLLYRVINAIENDISEKLGVKLKVLYGDTDSSYVLVPKSIPAEKLEEAVNEWIHEHYGPLYKMELEDTYSVMIIPKRKGSKEPSAKSYILLDENGKIKKLKGEFYKITAPLAIKDRPTDFFEGLIKRNISSKDELREYIKEFLKDEPIYKYFIKKSVSSFVSEDDPSRFKRLNKPFHYAALVSLCENRAPGTREVERRVYSTLSRFVEMNRTGKEEIVRCEIDPRVVEDTQRAIIVHYLPNTRRNSKKFVLYGGEDGDDVIVYEIEVLNIDTISDQNENALSKVDKAYEIEYKIHEKRILKKYFIKYVLLRLEREVISTLFEKLIIPSLNTKNGGGA
jgi:DNA polymerase elongation subunit (family B)